jgi:hypothetical protein
MAVSVEIIHLAWRTNPIMLPRIHLGAGTNSVMSL